MAEDWAQLYQCQGSDESAAIFYSILDKHISKASKPAQVKNNKSKYRPIKPWITHGLIVSIRQKEQMYRQMLLYPNDMEKKVLFKKYRNMLTNLIKDTKNEYYHNQITRAGKNPKTYGIQSTRQ